MPRRGKRGGAGAPPRNSPRPHSSRNTGRSASILAADASLNASTAAFTLQDEARSTAHRSSPWSTETQLRHRPVIFVSTGVVEPLKKLEEDILKNELTTQPKGDRPDRLSRLSTPANDATSLCQPESSVDLEQLYNTSGEHHVRKSTTSTTGKSGRNVEGQYTQDNLNLIGIKAQSEPVVEVPTPLPFFLDVTGHKNTDHKPEVRTQSRSPSPAVSDSSEEVILFRGRNKPVRDKDKPFNLGGIRTEIQVVEQTVNPTDDECIDLRASNSSRLKRTSCGTRSSKQRQEEDDIIADYISNIREHGDDEGLLPAKAYSRRDLGGSISESESIEESFHTIKASRSLNSMEDTPENAIADAGNSSDGSDTDYTPVSRKLHSNKEKAARNDNALLTVLETDTSYLGSIEQSHTEASLQSDITDRDADEDEMFNTAADRFANDLDDFDFMDWDRPALKRKKGKGAKGKVPIFDMSDSELESKMQAAWTNDRLKKAERKRERQTLRAQGLLGKHANPEDLRVKYPSGMGLDQIADELKAFLLGSNAILTLPPMDNHARKIIHELASKFNIKSKSTGSGQQRRPMLHRTFKTVKFAEESFDSAIARVGRKYFPRNDTALRAAVQRQSVRRGGGHAGVQYRDGEIVGGSAPELGSGNKGHAMLEKMGWSSGTALGALNNKGILQPVAHIVKRSKAGLG
ncbi:G-patch domain-containing protein [Colletotrichum truncatum]|uniref:G-patch domain-containing protein n=1 Tax=Colletotrichum truncatum TaxID=5467 RepID=A0ACC3YXK8_COLTU